ncbi:MAG: type IV pilin protein [Planctomycetota bacterium]
MHTSRARVQSGFTLIEMLIVTALIAVIASIAVPNLLSSKLVSNETAAIATMRAISSAQFQFQTTSIVDLNNDGGSEFGTLRELGGLDPVRGASAPLAIGLLSKSAAITDATGGVTLKGYRFRMFLPAADGTGVVATAANAAQFDATLSQRYWTCVAWPIVQGKSGKRAFFINQQGMLLESRETDYDGSSVEPDAGAGLVGVPPTNIDADTLATGGLGADGNAWVMVQ